MRLLVLCGRGRFSQKPYIYTLARFHCCGLTLYTTLPPFLPPLSSPRPSSLARHSASSNNLAVSNSVGGAIAEKREAPTDLRSAIEAGDVLAVGSMVRTMSQEEAEVELVAQDR